MKSAKKIRIWWWSENNPRFWWMPRKNKKENFGDLLAFYLTEKITGQTPVFTHLDHPFKPTIHLITGSILQYATPNCIAWGPGIIKQDAMVQKADFRAVRGPLTRARLMDLGYQVPEVYGDPGLLLPRFYQPKASSQKYTLGIIPHYVDYEKVKTQVENSNDRAEILVINLLAPIEQVVDEIAQCQVTVSSSLHGIITSQAYGIPCLWTRFSDGLTGDDTKFRDYFLSVGIEPYPFLDYRNRPLDLTSILQNHKKKPHQAFIQKDLNELSELLLAVCPF